MQGHARIVYRRWRTDPSYPSLHFKRVQNGRHERMHRTLEAETAAPPAANKRQQQKRFDACRRIFNEERPHAAPLEKQIAAILPTEPFQLAEQREVLGHALGRD